MLPTESTSWNGLQALKSRLIGRFARFSRERRREGRPRKVDNDSIFFETDLRHLLEMTPEIVDLSENDYQELDRSMRKLLSFLNDTVNQDSIAPSENATRQQSELSLNVNSQGTHQLSRDVTMLGNSYPQLVALINFLDTTSDPINLTSGSGILLFSLPHGEPGREAMVLLADCKKLLERISMDTRQASQTLTRPTVGAHNSDTLDDRPETLCIYAHSTVDTIFKEFQGQECNIHEIKLQVSKDLHTSPDQPMLDMFISCCQATDDWQEARCRSFQHGLELEKKHTLCAAVHKSKVHGRTLHLLVKEKEVFDVSEDLPVQSTYLKNYDYMTETLKSLLDDKRLCPMCPSAYLDGTAALRFQSHEKVALALALARCLVDFFNEDLELASHTWNPERIFLIRTSQVAKDEHQLYISLRPKSPGLRSTNTPETIQIGDPVLLAFARLLMEINSGEKILFEIHPRREDNITIWAKMCDLLSQLERDRSSFFFEAVKGCLYLHTRLQTLRRQGPAQVSNLDIKKVIYENVVKNLELELNPDSLKRKRSSSDDEDEEEHSVIKKSFKREDGSRKIQQLPAARLSRVPSLHNSDSDLTSLANSPPRDRDSFEVAILCALPLEYDAVSLLMDRIWDNDHDLDGRNDNDSNAYMTGRIGRFNVVLVLLSNMGKVGAASSAASLRSSYPKLKFVFLTGICGGVPRPGTDEEILLGDVIISKAAIQYDHGRLYPDGLAGRDEIEDSLGRLPKKIRNLVTVLETDLGREKLEKRTNYFLQQLQSNPFKSRSRRNYKYPGAENDILYKANFRHKHHETPTCICVRCHKSSDPVCEESRKLSCEELGCDEEQTVPRERLNTKRYQELNGQKEEAQAPSIFVGRVGSGDTVVKSGEDRDKIAKRHNLLAFEMEAAGIWDEIPCIVVKGVCDYADSHKNKSWQAFASATAACATKALLERVPR